MLILKTFHALYARLCSLVLVLELGDLVAHRVQLLKLVLEALLLRSELLSLEAFLRQLLLFLILLHLLLHVSLVPARSRTARDATSGLNLHRGRFLPWHGRSRQLSRLSVVVEKESHFVVYLLLLLLMCSCVFCRSVVPVLCRL